MDFNFTDRRGRDEPTGEVMPLTKNMLAGVKMGDKFMRMKPPQGDQKKSKKFAFFICIFLIGNWFYLQLLKGNF